MSAVAEALARSDDAPAAPASAAPVLELHGISKSFPGVRALEQVALTLHAGRVTALVGENGAGKSTLVKILTGINQPDAGEVRIDGVPVHFPTAQAAQAAGVTAIHQETVLFDELSVAETIFIGHAPRTRWGMVDWSAMRKRAAEVLARIEVAIDPATKLKNLSIAQRHLVAIARALSVEARIVIMDEPTAALSYKEAEDLFRIVEALKQAGKAILFISHKFDEIYRIADDYVVFRDGSAVGAGRLADIDHSELVRLMVGRKVDQVFPKRDHKIGAAILEVADYRHPS